MERHKRSVWQRICDVFAVLVTPNCWIQVDPYSEDWDRELTWLMDNGFTFEWQDNFRAKIADYRVWVRNHPYGSFEIDNKRPRRATILRAGKLLGLGREPQRRFRGDRHYREAGGSVDELIRQLEAK
jgi:hypothetical protein